MKKLNSDDLSLNLKKVSNVSNQNSSVQNGTGINVTEGNDCDTKDTCINYTVDKDVCNPNTFVKCDSNACQSIACSLSKNILCCEFSNDNCPPMMTDGCEQTDVCVVSADGACVVTVNGDCQFTEAENCTVRSFGEGECHVG